MVPGFPPVELGGARKHTTSRSANYIDEWIVLHENITVREREDTNLGSCIFN